MLKQIQRVLKSTKGTTALEYAIILPVLLYLLLGIVDFSLIMYASAVLQGATLAAAREGATGCSTTGQDYDTGCIYTTLASRVGGLLNTTDDDNPLNVCTVDYGSVATASLPASPPPCISSSYAPQGAGHIVIYTVTYNWPIVTPFLDKFLGDGHGNYMLVGTALVQNEPY